MGKRCRRCAEFAREGPEGDAAIEIRDNGVIRRQFAVEPISECATLYRTDAKHAGIRLPASDDDLAGATRAGEIFELTR